MKQWTWLGGALAVLGSTIGWLHSVGELPAGFLYWSIIAMLGFLLTYGVSWSVTQVHKRQNIPKPWDTNGNKKRIERTAIAWAFLPSASFVLGIALTHDVPRWYWLVAPWVVILLSSSSSWLWWVIFEIFLPRLFRKRIRKADGSEMDVPVDHKTDHKAGDRTVFEPKGGEQ